MRPKQTHTRRSRPASTYTLTRRHHVHVHRRYRLLRHAGLRERKETRKREPTTPIAYMVDRAGGARFGALSAPSWFRCLHCCSDFERRRRTHEAGTLVNPKNLSVGLAFSDDDHRKTSRDTPGAHRCTDSYVERTREDPCPLTFSEEKSSEKA